jgi:hypothetical protein
MRLFTLYWGVALLLLPIFYRVSFLGDVRWHQHTLFVWLGLVSLVLFDRGRVPKSLSIAAAVILVLSYFNQYNMSSSAAIWQTINIAVGFGVCFQMISIFDEYDRRLMCNFIGLACIVQVLWFLCQSFGHSPYYWMISSYWGEGVGLKKIVTHGTLKQVVSPDSNISMIGSLGQQTLSGAMLAITAPFLLRKWWCLALPLVGYCVYLTGSAMTTVSFVGGMLASGLFYIYPHIKIKYCGLAAVWATLPTYWLIENVDFFDDQLRMFVWGKMLVWYKGFDVLIGRGPGYVYDNFRNYLPLSPGWQYLHNEYLEIYGAFGLVGLICLVVFALPVIKSSKSKYFWFGGLSALMINALGSFPMHISATALVGVVIYSMILSKFKEDSNGINSN